MAEWTLQEQAYQNGYDKGFADAKAELVRCKDCRWAEDIENPFLRDVFVAGAKNCRVKRGDDAYGVDCSVVSPNDFCSDGERREGE